MLRIKAAAKINLTLDVLFRREDGYHEVDMIMQSVGLYDELTIREERELSIAVEGDAPLTTDNLVYKAAALLKNRTKTDRGAEIFLKKQIPTAAGLGGGSADAAATLVGLNHLWGLHLPLSQLEELASSLGADVPFCIRGGTQRATSIGTDLSPLPHPPAFALLIIKPCDGVITKEVYQSLSLDAKNINRHTKNAVGFLFDKNFEGLCASMGNSLESVTIKMRPRVQETMDALLSLGAITARMSGSGPSVFGVFQAPSEAENARNHIGGWICEPISAGIEVSMEPEK